MAKAEIIPNLSDHDALITLIANSKNNHQTVLEKIGDVKDNVTDIKEGLTQQLSDHENRIKILENSSIAARAYWQSIVVVSTIIGFIIEGATQVAIRISK